MAKLKFDSRNRLVQAGGMSYRYDAENQRVGVNETSYIVNSQPRLSQVLVREEKRKKTWYVYDELGLIVSPVIYIEFWINFNTKLV
jgi:hypothetical protein